MKYNEKIIGERIRQARKDKDWSQDRLIEELRDRQAGISRGKLVSIERGKAGAFGTLSLTALFAMCEMFDCDMGYLLGEYDERHRVAAEVCDATGLDEVAVQRLLTLKADRAGQHREQVFGATPRAEILSRIIADPEFWRIINNLSVWTSPVIADSMSMFNVANTFAPATEEGIAELEPLSTPIQDTEIASAAMHFFNVAKRAVGWDADVTGKQNTAPADESKR